MENIDFRPDDLAKTMDDNFKALRQINYEDLSDEEKAELKKEFEELQEMILSLKEKCKKKG